MNLNEATKTHADILNFVGLYNCYDKLHDDSPYVLS